MIMYYNEGNFRSNLWKRVFYIAPNVYFVMRMDYQSRKYNKNKHKYTMDPAKPN